MENTEQIKFERFEKIANRSDMIVSIGQIVYYIILARNLSEYMQPIMENLPMSSMYMLELFAVNTSLLGILLLVVGMVVFSAVFYLNIKKHQRKEISTLKTVLILIWNGVWILGDAYMLYFIIMV